MTNFTFSDAVGSAAATSIFALVLYGPGFFLGFVTDLFNFRKLGILHQTAWAVAFSFGTTPLLLYLAGKFITLNFACGFVLLAGIAGIILAARKVLLTLWTTRRRRPTLILCCAWVLFVFASLLDIQVGHRLYFSVVQFDQSYRVAFTDAVMRTGIPPANPLYFAGAAQPMRYYYFWYLLCACVAKLGHVSARQAVTASSVWAGVGLAAMISLYVRHFFGVVDARRRQVLVSVALLFVTGADLLPAIGSLFSQPALNGDMEWWSVDQFASWQDSVLWVPHHTAALLCCLLVFLLVWKLSLERAGWRSRWAAIALAGAAFASAFGLSIYLTAGFALLMFALVSRQLMIGSPGRMLARNLVFAAVASAVASAPFLFELMTSHSSAAAGEAAGAGHVLAFGIRRLVDPALLTGLPAFASINTAHPVLLDTLMRLLLLPIGLALELGVYGVVFWLVVRGRHPLGQNDPRRIATFLSVAGLLIVVFVRSTVIGNNDFGYRAALLPQFFLLLLAGDLLQSWRTQNRASFIAKTPLRQKFVLTLIVLGVAGTVYQAVILRFFLPLEAGLPISGFSSIPAEAFDARTAFAQFDSVSSPAAVIVINPIDSLPETRGDVVPPFTFYIRTLLLNANRQILTAEPHCAAHFGGDIAPCSAIEQGTAHLYAQPAPSAGWASGYCSQFHVQYLVASELDPAWRDPAGWVWTLTPITAQPSVRILQCAPATTP